MLVRPFNTIKLLRIIMLFILLCCCYFSANAQYFDLKAGKKRVTIPFRLVRDLVVIRLNINGKGPYNFVLDTGVGLMLITDPKLVDSINVADKRTVNIGGLGEGDDFEAYVTSALNVEISGLTSYDVAATILKTDHFGLSNYAGIPIQGLLGYEFFTNLAVKINFADSTITVSRPKDMRRFTAGSKVPITIEDRKPYLQATVTYPNGAKANNKLVIDIGAGHPLLLENAIKNHGLPENFITSNLGVGLTGPISGLLSRVKELDVGRFKIKSVITSFPVEPPDVKPQVPRDGNMGMGILERFTIIFDYPDSVIYLKPGPKYDSPFEHDMSGLEYYRAGENYSHVIISRVEPGSAADLIGLEKDDEIVSIDFKPVSALTLEQIDAIFESSNGRNLILEIFHDKKYDRVIMTLKRRI